MQAIPRRILIISAAWLILVGGLLSVGWAADAVILTDGFVLQGKVMKERNIRGYPFDLVEDGPKVVIFSSHSRKGGKVEKNVLRPEFTAYKRDYPRTGLLRAPGFGEFHAGDFDENWRRTMQIRRPDGHFHEVKQIITFLDPNSCYVASTTHNWRVAYHTAEMDVAQVIRLLKSHPDLKEPEGKPDPAKRLAIVTFLKDTGWLQAAREHLDEATKMIPGEWPKEQAERAEKLRQEIDTAETRRIIDELEAAVNAGRYETARRFLAVYVPKSQDPDEMTRLTVLKAQIETVQPKYEQTHQLLKQLIDRVDGTAIAAAHSLAAGAMVMPLVPRPKLAEPLATLTFAARTILEELHPDSAGRIELFRTLAEQELQRENMGRAPLNKPEALLALAITGWLKGKNGAETDVASARKCWATREVALRYFREEIGNNRRMLLDNYLNSGNALPPDELAQVISLLPPPMPQDLSQPIGVEAPRQDALVPGIFRRTAVTSLDTAGAAVDYFLRLPPEYHHGRSYPLLIALTHPTIASEKLVGMLSEYTDRYGYIVAAPVWANQFSEGYDYSGKQHPTVQVVLQDLLRHFQVDPDKVFLFGFGEGATFAFDMGASHPDLFAGVVVFGGMPKAELYMHYWRNTQKLPYYVVTGENAGGSAELMRKVFENWMPRGFPALLTMYKGRGVEWYAMELPRAFDWMNRKSRVRGTASLRLHEPLFEPWQILRPGDNRFYWVGTTEVKPGHQFNDRTVRNGLVPASIGADIVTGNKIVVRAFGVRNVVIWLERTMIDWTRPVAVQLNGQTPYGYRAQVMQPDLHLMFETLYATQDRKMLFLGRLEFPVP